MRPAGLFALPDDRVTVLVTGLFEDRPVLKVGLDAVLGLLMGVIEPPEKLG